MCKLPKVITVFNCRKRARNQLLFTRRPTFHPHGKTKGKWKLMGKEVNSRAHKYNGRVKSVKSRGYLSSLKITSHVINGRSTRGVGFCAKTLSKEAQVSLKWIATLAIHVRQGILDWENPEGDRCPFDLSKRLPLKGRPGHLTVASKYFFNNDLEYLKSIDSERMYTTSIIKMKAARYDLVEEIVMRRADRQLYNFKEGDFINLHLNDIEDMLLLVVQHKLFHLDGEVIVDLAVALRMFTRSLIIKKMVKDVQLGVESYQKKLNITKPQKYFPTISTKEPFTPSFEPPGVVYKDLSNRKRLMQADELYKFSD
ncbi:hypothetical protein Tco_1062365 [Tanacetum coccineum]